MERITIDHHRLRMHVIVEGFPQRDGVEALTAQIRDNLSRFGPKVGEHTIFCDLSGALVAPGDVITSLLSTLTKPEYHSLRARRLAFFLSSPLARLQVERLRAARAGIRVFTDRNEAHAWLDQDEIELVN